MMKPYGDLQKRANDNVDTRLRRIINTGGDYKKAAQEIFRDPNYPSEVKEVAMRRFLTGYIYNQVISRIPTESRIGLPGLQWWQSSAQTLNPRDRATLFFSEWKRKPTAQRNAMWNVAKRLSTQGLGFSYIDQQRGLFMDEFKKLKERYGSGAESSFIDLKVDLATPSLDSLKD